MQRIFTLALTADIAGTDDRATSTATVRHPELLATLFNVQMTARGRLDGLVNGALRLWCQWRQPHDQLRTEAILGLMRPEAIGRCEQD